MNKYVSDFLDEFTVKHIVKHTLITCGLTLMGGPWGIVMGLTYCFGDTVGEMKKFKTKDMLMFLKSLPPETYDALERVAKENKNK